MISQQEFIARLIAMLDSCGIPYMVCGSVASSFHGEPRATKDVDLVVECGRSNLGCLLRSMHDADWYVSDAAAEEAIERRTMFNVIDTESGWKADLIVRKARAFSICEFERREAVAFPAVDRETVSLTTPEDTILSKLEWSLASRSEQQYRDARNVSIVAGEKLDRVYLRKWAPDLGVGDLLETLLAETDEHLG